MDERKQSVISAAYEYGGLAVSVGTIFGPVRLARVDVDQTVVDGSAVDVSVRNGVDRWRHWHAAEFHRPVTAHLAERDAPPHKDVKPYTRNGFFLSFFIH